MMLFTTPQFGSTWRHPFFQVAFYLFGCDKFLDKLDLIVPEVCGSMILLIGLYTYVTRKQGGDPILTQTMKN